MKENIANLWASLTGKFGDVLPGVLGALLVLIIGFIVAGIVKRLAKSLLSKTSIDDRLSSKMGSGYRLDTFIACLLYTSPSPRDKRQSRMPSSA